MFNHVKCVSYHPSIERQLVPVMAGITEYMEWVAVNSRQWTPLYRGDWTAANNTSECYEVLQSSLPEFGGRLYTRWWT
jgi:hypothetical protein